MTNFLDDLGILLLSIALLIGGIVFTVFLILNEKKLKETKPKQELKKMYKDEIYVSLSFIITGIIVYVSSIYTEGIVGVVAYFGSIILSAGLLATICSSIALYNAVYKNKKSEFIKYGSFP